MPNRSTIVLAVALVGSLALNARLLVSRPSPTAAAPRADSSAAAAVAAASVDPGTCQRRLGACEQKVWEQLRRTMANDRPQPPPPPSPEGTGPAGSGRAEQEAALCAKAEAELRSVWRADRDKIAAGLAKSLADPAEQARNVASEADKMRIVAGLDDREAAAVASAYRDQRMARIAEAQTALGRDPPDFAALLDSVRGLYTDEDATLARIAGAGAQEAWRTEQLEGRTVVMAAAAAMAEKDWDQSIRW